MPQHTIADELVPAPSASLEAYAPCDTATLPLRAGVGDFDVAVRQVIELFPVSCDSNSGSSWLCGRCWLQPWSS